MTNIVHIIPEPPNIKNNIKKVEKRIKEASDEISKAKRELNDANYSELSYEINQLESMYKKTNEYASEFETFASKVETMVNEYITADKNCANKIRSNGKSHRQKTGLPKNLSAALISSSFDKLGDAIEDIKEDLKTWVENIMESFKESIIEDWDSYIQGIGAFVQIISSSAIILLCLGAAATGVGAPVSLPVAGAALASLITGFDKLIASIADIGFNYETNGDSLSVTLAKKCGIEWYSYIFEGVDFISSIYAGGAMINKIFTSKTFINIYYMMDRLDRVDDIPKLAKLFKVLGNTSNWTNVIDGVTNVKDLKFDDLFTDNILPGIAERILV